MNKENCALKLVDEIILYYDARSKKHQITLKEFLSVVIFDLICVYNLPIARVRGSQHYVHPKDTNPCKKNEFLSLKYSVLVITSSADQKRAENT